MKTRRLLATLMALAMCLTLLPVGVLADWKQMSDVQVTLVGTETDENGQKWLIAETSWPAGDNLNESDIWAALIDSSGKKYDLNRNAFTIGNQDGWPDDVKFTTKDGRNYFNLKVPILNANDEQTGESSGGGPYANGVKEGDEFRVAVTSDTSNDPDWTKGVKVVYTKENVAQKKTFTVESGEPNPDETHTAYFRTELAAGVTDPGTFRNVTDSKPNLKNGDPYSFDVPSFEGLIADRTEVSGTMGNADIYEVVSYRANNFKVTVRYFLGEGVTTATDPGKADGGHYATGQGSLINFPCSYEGNPQQYVPGEEDVAWDLKDGETYSWTPPAYLGLRPNPAVVAGTIEGADVVVDSFNAKLAEEAFRMLHM